MLRSLFALKGGTAIHLFVRDMPRLSVDIDLAYLPARGPRETALQKKGSAPTRVAAVVQKAIPGAKVQAGFKAKAGPAFARMMDTVK